MEKHACVHNFVRTLIRRYLELRRSTGN